MIIIMWHQYGINVRTKVIKLLMHAEQCALD